MATLLQIPHSVCCATVELKTMDNGDRTELYKWDFEIPRQLRTFETDFALPTPTFEQGLFSQLSWTQMQAFVSTYRNGLFQLYVPCPFPNPTVAVGGDEQAAFAWSMDSAPEVLLFYKVARAAQPNVMATRGVKVLMNFTSTSLTTCGWAEGGPMIFQLPLLKVTEDKIEQVVERLRFTMRLDGKLKRPEGSMSKVGVEIAANAKSKTAKMQTLIPGLFNQPEFSDVKLLCQGETFYCHRGILSAGSPLFQQKFKTDKKEQIELPNIAKDMLKLMLEWMYGIDVLPKLKSVPQTIYLLKLSHQYGLDALQGGCADEILNAVTAENAFEIYVLGDKYGEGKLKSKATEVMKRHKTMFANEELFKDCHKRFPKLLQELLMP